MKALLVLMGMDIGGAETHVLELALGLKRKGVEVLIASNGGAYVKELEKEGVKHYKVPLNARSIPRMAKALFVLSRIIRTERPDVVHGHARIPSFLLGILCKFQKFNFVTTAHWVFEVTPALKLLTDWGYRTIAVSEDIKKYLIENYKTLPQDITVTINGIPEEKFGIPKDETVLSEFHLSETKRKIVSISRMDKDRSLLAHHLIASAPALLQQEDIEIVLVGGGNDFNAVKAEADEMNKKLGKSVIFCTGPRTDINRFVSAADFVVAVSRSALEAMCGGVPAIIAGNEGYLGIFDENSVENAFKTNFCCRGMEQSSPERLTKDLLTLLRADEKTLKNLGAFGKETVLKHYSVDRMVQDNLDVYKEIIKNGNKHKDFVVSGYYGHKNSGDDALLHAIISQIRTFLPKARFTVLSANPNETETVHGVHAVNRFNFFKARRAIKNASVLISGGGSLIQDVTSTKSLLYYSWVLSYAKRHGLKTFIYSNGIGPLVRKHNLKIARHALENADLITLRDEKSLELLKTLGISNEKNVYLTADPALSLPPAESAKGLIENENLPIGEYIGISLRHWTNDSSLSKAAAECADRLQTEYGLIPVFIPMQMPEDEEICRKALAQMKTKGYVLKKRYNYSDLMAFCGCCKAVIGMRLHTLLYAAAVGTPSVGIIYDPKILGCVAMLGQENSLISYEKCTADRLYALCAGILSHHDEIKEKLAKTTKILKENALKNGAMAVSLLEEGEV